LNVRQIWILYRHEIRCALRERSIVVASIVVPLVMYPLLLWAIFAGTAFVGGQAERLTSRVAVQGLPAAHRALADSLAAHDRVTLREWEADGEAARRDVAAGRLDAFVEFRPAQSDGLGLDDNFRVVIAYSEARERSQAARSRVDSLVTAYRRGWVDEARRDLGVDDPVWADFAVVRSDVSTPAETSRFLLSLFVPLLTLIMVAMAAFYPAIDATAGERERSTWETLMTVAAPRANVAAAKYLYVASFGALGGLLNLTALALSLGWILRAAGPDAAGVAGGGIPLGSLPVIALGIVLLGLFVAAGMLVLAVFARTFKEGQSMITPFYLAIFLPALFTQSPDLEFSTTLAAVPVLNVALLIRTGITGSLPLVQGGITIVTMVVWVAAAVAFAQWVMSREDVLLGTGEGGLWSYLKRRRGAGRRAA